MPDITHALNSLFSSRDAQIASAIVLGIISLIGLVAWGLDQLFAPISVMAYGIVGFFGKRGSGKSFGMTTYARRWRMFNKNKPVFTNMEKLVLPGYNGPCTCIYKADTDRYYLNRCKAVHTDCTFQQIEACRDGLVAIDEAGIFISSLNFVDRKNRQFARWIVATRHFKVMVLLTAHTPGTVNNRLRDVIDQFIVMSAFTTLKIFKGFVYDSAAAYGRPKERSQTVFIPMWRTTSKSYNTDSLRIKTDENDGEIVGEDFELPGLGEAMETKLNPDANKSTVPNESISTNNGASNGATYVMDSLPRNAANSGLAGVGVSQSTSDGSDFNLLDAALIASAIRRTTTTWNGRGARPIKPAARARTTRA